LRLTIAIHPGKCEDCFAPHAIKALVFLKTQLQL